MPPADQPAVPPPLAAEQSLDSFDLATLRAEESTVLIVVPRRCPVGKPGEIVVCAPNPEADRLRPLPDTYVVTEGLGRAERQIAPGTMAGVDMSSVAMPGGVVSNRVMFNLKMGF
ncbi:hypothetical protein [Novosphingobium clariflavum]|uniref:Uncharacterized protein n=1 Tax=Novosphingobium clariflavum TaxID=2029884 RepID=A0ABV6S160_9SPHN|nr:hypothetical protein [Novosphingobium clariflavum]